MFRDRIRELRRVEARLLRPNPRNWRTHPASQRRALSQLLGEVGFANAVLARELPDGSLELVDGHLRTDLAADAIVPVLVLDVTAAEADLILATLDPLAAMAGRDDAKLRELMSQLEVDSEKMRRSLADICQTSPWAELAVRGPATSASDAAQIVKAQKRWRVKPGQLWHIGPHRLLCGDATNADNYATLVGTETPVAMITDPPYGVDYDPQWRERKGRGVGSHRLPVANDTIYDWTAAFRLFRGPVAYVWHASRFTSDVERQLVACGFATRAQIIWAKQHFTLSRGNYHWQHEPCWYAVRRGAKGNWHGDRKQSTLWEIGNLSSFGGIDEEVTAHGTQKPLECMARPIRNNTAVGEIVYDPFLGSGTTMLAADRLDRVCYAQELLPEFCALTLERMARLCHAPKLAGPPANLAAPKKKREKRHANS